MWLIRDRRATAAFCLPCVYPSDAHSECSSKPLSFILHNNEIDHCVQRISGRYTINFKIQQIIWMVVLTVKGPSCLLSAKPCHFFLFSFYLFFLTQWEKSRHLVAMTTSIAESFLWVRWCAVVGIVFANILIILYR